MTLTQWFYDVFNKAIARWIEKDPVNAEQKVSGLVDKLINTEIFWGAVSNWLDANPDRIEPFIISFLNDASEPKPEEPVV